MVSKLSKEELEKRISEAFAYKDALKKIQYAEFFERYGRSPEETLKNYEKFLLKFYVQNADYDPWLPTISHHNHMGISGEGYKKGQPTEEERLAFKLVHDRDMKVPKKEDITVHHWGN